MQSWDKQDNIKHRGLEKSGNCIIYVFKKWLTTAVFLDSAEKQTEMWVVVKNHRSWYHYWTCSGSGFAGAAAGAGTWDG